jgi:hypothetical protein
MVKLEDMRNELRIVREELRDLKKCQVSYFALSVTGTAALLGLAAAPHKLLPGVAGYLAPLLILLPCWYIFFDKATTITRNVGYMRILEEMIAMYPQLPFRYLGFENALAQFRSEEDQGKGVPVEDVPGLERRRLPTVMALRTRHRYWMVNWYTFALLSVLCCGLGSAQAAAGWAKILAGLGCVLTGFSAIYTLVMVAELTGGRFSYDYYTACWRKFLS